MSKIDQIKEYCEEYEIDILLADGFDEAIVGVGECFNNPVAIYDYHKCVSILVERDGFTNDEAIEHMEYNVKGSYVGEKTPMFIMWKCDE